MEAYEVAYFNDHLSEYVTVLATNSGFEVMESLLLPTWHLPVYGPWHNVVFHAYATRTNWGIGLSYPTSWPEC